MTIHPISYNTSLHLLNEQGYHKNDIIGDNVKIELWQHQTEREVPNIGGRQATETFYFYELICIYRLNDKDLYMKYPNHIDGVIRDEHFEWFASNLNILCFMENYERKHNLKGWSNGIPENF